jgi:hypothetical protein
VRHDLGGKRLEMHIEGIVQALLSYDSLLYNRLKCPSDSQDLFTVFNAVLFSICDEASSEQ